MNWSKAKNISIVIFIVLNILLMYLNHVEVRRTAINSADILAIETLLNNNNIVLSDSFEISYNYPMRNIALNEPTLHQEFFQNTFMVSPTNIRIITSDDGTKRYNDYESIHFSNMSILYENIANYDVAINTIHEARMFSARIIRALGDIGRHFILESTYVNNGQMILEYRDIFRGFVKYSNFIIFTFQNGTIKSIDFNYVELDSFVSQPREVRQGDEILFNFMRHKRLNYDGKIIINKMDIVYIQENVELLVAEPFYRIYYSTDYGDEVIFFNAYSNLRKY